MGVRVVWRGLGGRIETSPSSSIKMLLQKSLKRQNKDKIKKTENERE